MRDTLGGNCGERDTMTVCCNGCDKQVRDDANVRVYWHARFAISYIMCALCVAAGWPVKWQLRESPMA